MISLDVNSLFANIPEDETIDICIDNLYISKGKSSNLAKHDFRTLLNIATKESFFTFNKCSHILKWSFKFPSDIPSNKYKQVDCTYGIFIRSSLS